MKIIKHCMLALALMAAMPSWAQTDEGVTRYVNPFIGTGQVDAHSLKGGNFPGATTPFGMVQLSPEEFVCPNGDGASGYDYSLNTIYGFAHTHLSGTGHSDLGDILIMPQTGKLQLNTVNVHAPSNKLLYNIYRPVCKLFSRYNERYSWRINSYFFS